MRRNICLIGIYGINSFSLKKYFIAQSRAADLLCVKLRIPAIKKNAKQFVSEVYRWFVIKSKQVDDAPAYGWVGTCLKQMSQSRRYKIVNRIDKLQFIEETMKDQNNQKECFSLANCILFIRTIC